MQKAVLIVDDEPTNRELLRIIFKKSDCTILEAKDGYEALEVYAQSIKDGFKVKAIIMDYLMPHLNGNEAITQLCRYHEFLTGQTFRQQDFTTAVIFTANNNFVRNKCDTCDKCAVIVKYKPDDLMSLKELA
jgi:CheY-like chemotaxis protein